MVVERVEGDEINSLEKNDLENESVSKTGNRHSGVEERKKNETMAGQARGYMYGTGPILA